jgi:hypothetical protein
LVGPSVTRTKRQTRQLTVCRCHICTSVVPITFEQQHHVVPQAAGGTDGQTVQLCSGCHHNLHRLADLMVGGRAGLAEDSAEIAYPDARIRARAFALAKTVAEYMVLKRDGAVDSGRPARVMIELPIPVKLAAQMIANEHRGQRGRPLGLATWVAALVKREVYQRYPHLDPNG